MKTTGRHRSWILEEPPPKTNDVGGLKKNPKITYPLHENGISVTSSRIMTIGRPSYLRAASYPMRTSSSIFAWPNGIKPAQSQASSSRGGRDGVADAEEGNLLFSSISSPGTAEMPISISMSTSIDSPALLSWPNPLLSSPSSPRQEIEKEIEILDDHLCRYIESATDDPDPVRMPSWEERTTIYFSVTKPSVPHEVFIKRLVRRAKISKRGFVYALMYLEKLRLSDVKLTLSPYNIHRLLVTALVIAGKKIDETCWRENLQSIVTVSEMDRLESVMFSLLDYNLDISKEDYSRFVRKLVQIHK